MGFYRSLKSCVEADFMCRRMLSDFSLMTGRGRESSNNLESSMSAQLQIAILEDNRDRSIVMRECLADRFSQYDIRFFVTAGEMITHLRMNLDRVLAIALDHDLDLIPTDPRRNIDPGSGRDVADFLTTQAAVCPVLIHSTNAPAAFGMMTELEEAGWTCERVIPDPGEDWIRNDWFPQFRNAIVSFSPPEKRLHRQPRIIHDAIAVE